MRRTLTHKRKARNKAGVGENRVTIISDYFKARPGPDLGPFIVQPYASNVIKRSIKSHINRREYKDAIVAFHTNLIIFKNALQSTSQNLNFKNRAKADLLRTIPVGRTAGALLNRPELLSNITELRTLLSGNFEYPERFSAQYNHLLWLLNETTTMVRKGLDEKEIDYPLIPQRSARARSSPREVMDLALGFGKRTRRMRRNRRRS